MAGEPYRVLVQDLLHHVLFGLLELDVGQLLKAPHTLDGEELLPGHHVLHDCQE